MTQSASLSLFDEPDAPAREVQQCPETVPPNLTGLTETEEVVEDFRIPEPIRELLGPIGPAIEDCFRRMSLAEAAIKRFCGRYPAHRPRLDKAFGILCWQIPVRVGDQIYIAHIEELLQRVVDRQSVSEATRAEALAFLHSASLRTPLAQQAAALYADLFQEVLHTAALFEEDKYPTEPWRGASAELLERLRRDLRVADRTFPSTGDTK